MLKTNYEKPQIEIIAIRVESSIANGSVHPGTTTGQYTPDVEDFEKSDTFEGMGDL